MITRTIWMPQTVAESLPYNSDTAFISITEPERPNARIDPEYEKTGKLLRLRFNDADEHFQNHVAGYEYDEPVLFTTEQANQILDFVEGLGEEVKFLAVHCHAGISRSAAVAIALAEIHGLEHMHPNYKLYNKLVYRKIQLAQVDRYESQITPDNCHEEQFDGVPVGKEIIKW